MYSTLMSAQERFQPADEADLRAQLAALADRVQTLESQMDLLQRPTVNKDFVSPAAPPPPPVFTPPTPDVTAPLSRFTEPQPERASLEKRLGSQVFNRIGIVALLIGCAWFLKLAIDNRWIGPVGRILVGLLAGAGIILWSERFRRRNYASFSYSLKAIGTGVLYLSLWAAFQLYHLFPAAIALLAMLLVAAWNAFMAWSQDAELLAAYALAGAMLTPGLLSTGGNHEIFLFTYLLGLDAAAIVLVRLKRWPRLLAGAFPATVAYFAGWYSSFYNPSAMGVTIGFAAALAAVFVAASLGVPKLEPESEPEPGQTQPIRTPFGLLLRHVLLPLANAAFVAFALYATLEDAGHHDAIAWAMLALAALYLAILRLPQPRLTAGVHLSVAVVLLSIVIPLKANGRWITIGWLVEGFALLLLADRSSRAEPGSGSQPFTSLLQLLSFGALTLGWFGALVQLYDGSAPVHAFFNSRFVTALAAVAATAAAALITAKRSRLATHAEQLSVLRHAAALLTIATNLMAVLAGVREVQALWQHAPASAEAQLQRALAVSAFLMFYGAALLAAGFVLRSAFLRWQALALLVFSILKTFLYDMRNLSQGYRVVSFLALGALLMAISFAYQKDWLSLREPETAP